jgi:serine/threonine-protein kinase
MAPEQAAGGQVDRRTDVYALGIVLWEMLTMRRRFAEETDIAAIRAVRNPTPVPPSVYCADIDPALDAVVLKATQPDADARFASARELRNALVEACPRAASMHESMLAGLLDATMNERKQQQRAELPSTLTGQIAVDDVDDRVAHDALHTMTISATSIEILPDMVTSSVVSEADTRLMDPEDLPGLDEGAAAIGTGRAPLPRWALILLVTSGLAFVVGVGAAVIAHQMDEGASGEATALPPLPAPSSSEPPAQPPAAPIASAGQERAETDVVAPVAAEDAVEDDEIAPLGRDDEREGAQRDGARTARSRPTKRGSSPDESTRTRTQRPASMTPTTMRITTEFF